MHHRHHRPQVVWAKVVGRGWKSKASSFFSIQGQRIMKTFTKTLAVLGLAAFVAGCAESNESIGLKDASGKVTQGVNPPGLQKSSADFAKSTPGAMGKPKSAEEYKKQTGQ
jgi:hypothetical protein